MKSKLVSVLLICIAIFCFCSCGTEKHPTSGSESITENGDAQCIDIPFSEQGFEYYLGESYKYGLVQVFCSLEEWKNYEEVFENSDSACLESIQKYDEAYFEDHVLVVIVLPFASSTCDWSLRNVQRKSADGKIEYRFTVIDTSDSDISDADYVNPCIFVELDARYSDITKDNMIVIDDNGNTII